MITKKQLDPVWVEAYLNEQEGQLSKHLTENEKNMIMKAMRKMATDILSKQQHQQRIIITFE